MKPPAVLGLILGNDHIIAELLKKKKKKKFKNDPSLHMGTAFIINVEEEMQEGNEANV